MLDKKTLIGLVLIFAVFIGYGIWTAPSQEQRAEAKRKQDSIINVKNQLAKSLEEPSLNARIAELEELEEKKSQKE